MKQENSLPGAMWYNCADNTTLMMGENGEWKVIYPSSDAFIEPKEGLWDKASRLFKRFKWKG